MPTRVQLSDGRVVTVQTDDPQEAARAAHRYQQSNPASAQHPTWRAQNVEDRLRGGPSAGYRRAYDRERRNDQAVQPLPGLAWTDQIGRNVGYQDELAAGVAWAGQGLDNIGRRMAGRPIEITQAEAMRAAADYQNAERDRFAREHPGQNALSIATSIPLFAGTPAAAPTTAPSAIRTGVQAAAINAPFAVARQEGSFAERLPGAAQETAVVGAFGTGLQGLANRFAAAPRPNSAAARAQQFEQAGVRPTAAGVMQGTPSAATRLISENFIAGAPARARLQQSLDDTAARAREISAQYGQHGQPEHVGEAVQRGVQRWARDRNAPAPSGRMAPENVPTRDWSFRAKSEALYNRVFQRIEADEAAHLSGQTGVRATATSTRQALADIEGRVSAPALAEIINSPQISRVAQALRNDEEVIRFADLRALRSWVREQRNAPAMTQTIDEASLARLEGALTDDIYRSALEIGDATAAQQLRRVDQFYRAGQTRIDAALQAFDPQRIGGAQAYQRIVALAREGGRQNTRQLQQVRNTLRPEEWRQVAASVIDDMGRPTAGHPGALDPATFSVENFVTNYARLTPEGRRILFGGNGTEGLASALDNLAQVAGYQKGVERMANASRSGVNVQNFGSIAGLANPTTTMTTATLLGGMAITGEMLTNPAFVRWFISAQKATGGSGGMRQQMAALATIAARDPAVAPFYTELVQRAERQFRAPREQQPERTGQPQ